MLSYLCNVNRTKQVLGDTNKRINKIIISKINPKSRKGIKIMKKMNVNKEQISMSELEQVNGSGPSIQDILKSTTAILMFL